MGERKEEDLYRNFSRKDLQGLCRKYGLPANKSSPEMATSLILYLEKKNLSSRVIWEGTRSNFFASEKPELQAAVRMNLTDDQRKDFGLIASRSGSGNYRQRNRRDAEQIDLQKCKGSPSSDKASVDVGNLTQLHRESNSGAGIQENTFSSVVSSSAVTPSPTFTYDVYSEDGIQLYVDLNSSPSDFIENLKAGVHICHHVHKPISKSFHQDIGLLFSKKNNCSVIMDISKEADNGQLEVGAYPTAAVADFQAQTDEPKGLEFLSNDFISLDKSKEEQANLESDTQGNLPGIESSRSEEKLAADSGSNVMVQTGICCDFKGNSMPYYPNCSGLPVHQDANSGNDIYEKVCLQQTNGSLDAVLKCSESSTTDCTEMQASTCVTLSRDFEYSPSGIQRCVDLTKPLKNSKELKSVQTLVRDELQTQPVQAVDQIKSVSSSPVMNSCSLDLPDMKMNKVKPQRGITSFFRKTDWQIREAQTHSAENTGFSRKQRTGRATDEEQKKMQHFVLTELNEDDICRIPSAVDVGKLGTRDAGNGSEGLKWLNHKDQLVIPYKRPVGSESNAELKRKRNSNAIEGDSNIVNTEAKISSSSKQFVEDVHSKRRRSSRLFIK